MNWIKKHKLLTVIIGFIFIVFLSAMGNASSQNKSLPETSTSTQQVATKSTATPKPAPTPQPAKPVDPLSKIPQIISNKYDGFKDGVILFSGDGSGQFATATNGPWEVFAATQLSSVKGDCSGTKIAVYDTMRAIYTDSSVKDHIARVQISISPMVNASLGGDDGRSIKDWRDYGPTLFAKTLGLTSSIKDDTAPLAHRTYWASINGNCPAN